MVRIYFVYTFAIQNEFMTVNQSIQKTTEWAKHDFKMFDYAFFCEQVIVGLVRDGFTKVQPEIEGEWLYVWSKSGVPQEVNIYKIFQSC